MHYDVVSARAGKVGKFQHTQSVDDCVRVLEVELDQKRPRHAPYHGNERLQAHVGAVLLRAMRQHQNPVNAGNVYLDGIVCAVAGKSVINNFRSVRTVSLPVLWMHITALFGAFYLYTACCCVYETFVVNRVFHDAIPRHISHVKAFHFVLLEHALPGQPMLKVRVIHDAC